MLFTQWSNWLKKNNFRLQLPDDRAILAICMGIALLFWIFIKLSQTYNARKPIKFSLILPEDKTFLKKAPNDAFVELQGVGWDLFYEFFISSAITLEYDVSGSDITYLSRSKILTDIRQKLNAKNLNIQTLNYDGIEVKLSEKKSKKIPVQLRSEVILAPGYQLLQPIQIEPDSIQISGPQPIVDSIQFWPSDSIKIENLESNLEQTLTLLEGQEDLILSNNKIQVKISIEQFTENTINYIPLEIRNQPDSNLRIFPRNVSVSFVVGLSRFSDIKAQDFIFIADFNKMKSDLKENEINIELVKYPDSIRNIKFSPKTASFLIYRDSSDIKSKEN